MAVGRSVNLYSCNLSDKWTMFRGNKIFQREFQQLFYADSVRSAMLPYVRMYQVLSYNPFETGLLRKAYWSLLVGGGLCFYMYHRLPEPCIGHSCLQKQFMTGVAVLNLLSIGLLYPLAARSLALSRVLARVDAMQDGPGFQYSTRHILPLFLQHFLYLCNFLAMVTLFQTRKDLNTVKLLLYRLTQFVPIAMTSFFTRPFVVLVVFIEQHFALITDKVSAASDSRSIERMLHLHHLLAELTENLGDACGAPLLVFVILIFLNITGALYFLSCFFMNFLVNPRVYLAGIVFSIVYCLQWLILFLQIVLPCDKCQFKAKRFTTVLFNKMIEDETNNLIKSDKMQLHLMMKREVKFTACGFFPLDNTLIHSIAAAVTTYLLILIQFGPRN